MPESKLIYLAAPYTHHDAYVIEQRMQQFDAEVAKILNEGHFPVSPLMNHTIIGKHNLPGNWEFWQHYSRRLLARCDELHVLKLEGWENSTGVTGEIDFACSLSIPIIFRESLYP